MKSFYIVALLALNVVGLFSYPAFALTATIVPSTPTPALKPSPTSTPFCSACSPFGPTLECNSIDPGSPGSAKTCSVELAGAFCESLGLPKDGVVPMPRIPDKCLKPATPAIAQACAVLAHEMHHACNPQGNISYVCNEVPADQVGYDKITESINRLCGALTLPTDRIGCADACYLAAFIAVTLSGDSCACKNMQVSYDSNTVPDICRPACNKDAPWFKGLPSYCQAHPEDWWGAIVGPSPALPGYDVPGGFSAACPTLGHF